VVPFLEIVAIVVGLCVGVGGIVATIWAVGRVKGVETSIDLLSTANEALRSANEDLRVELAHSERTCAERLARLEGQNAALLDGLGDKLAQAIAGRLEQVLTDLAGRVVDGITDQQTRSARQSSP
jgi:hypothetical protein